MYYIYVLISKKDNNFYVGYSTNLMKRLKYHKYGLVKSTKPRRPLELIFYEVYKSKEDAERREKYFKTTDGKRCLKLMLKETLNNKPPKYLLD